MLISNDFVKLFVKFKSFLYKNKEFLVKKTTNKEPLKELQPQPYNKGSLQKKRVEYFIGTNFFHEKYFLPPYAKLNPREKNLKYLFLKKSLLHCLLSHPILKEQTSFR